jgi:hypothetical protein
MVQDVAAKADRCVETDADAASPRVKSSANRILTLRVRGVPKATSGTLLYGKIERYGVRPTA